MAALVLSACHLCQLLDVSHAELWDAIGDPLESVMGTQSWPGGGRAPGQGALRFAVFLALPGPLGGSIRSLFLLRAGALPQ